MGTSGAYFRGNSVTDRTYEAPLHFTNLTVLHKSLSVDFLSKSSIKFHTSIPIQERDIRIDRDLVLLDIANWDMQHGLARIAKDRAALQRYFEALDQGLLGRAIRERYLVDGQSQPNGTIGSTGLSIDELIVSDMQEYIDEDDDRLPAT